MEDRHQGRLSDQQAEIQYDAVETDNRYPIASPTGHCLQSPAASLRQTRTRQGLIHSLASATAETESTIRPENLMAAGGQLRRLILLITADRVIIRTRTNIPMNRALQEVRLHVDEHDRLTEVESHDRNGLGISNYRERRS